MASEMRGRLVDNFLQTIDLPKAPALRRSGVKPPDPDQDVDGAHKVLGGKCRFSRSGDTTSKWDAILPAHHMVELAVRCGARLDDMATPGKLDAFRERSSSRRAGHSRNYGGERTCKKSPSSVTRAELPSTFTEFAVVFRMAAKWRATQNKTANSYVIEISFVSIQGLGAVPRGNLAWMQPKKVPRVKDKSLKG